MTTINKKTATKYSGSIPELFLQHCGTGASTPEFCVKIGVAYSTFKLWCNTYPEMGKAKLAGKKIAEAWWMNKAKEHLVINNTPENTTKFDTSLYKFIMAGRFGHTSDNAMQKRIAELELMVDIMKKAAEKNHNNGVYAQHAECEPDDDN